MKLSLTIQTPEVEPLVPIALLRGTFEEKLAKAAQWGADGVELMTTAPLELDADKIRANLKTNGLEVSAIGSGANVFAFGLTLLNADRDKAILARKRLNELIDFAQKLDAPLVTIGGFRGRLSAFGEEGKKYLIEVLREAATYSQQRSVKLALEPLNRYESDFINNATQGLEFVQEVNHPMVGLLLDTFHVNIEESSWKEPFQCLMNAQKLWHVHLGDNNRLPPGKGMIDFVNIVRILREIGYSGYLSAELLAKPDPDSAARYTLTYMRSIFAMTQ